MQRRTVATAHSVGLVARHNISNARGQRILAKGRVITPADVEILLAQQIYSIDVVQYDVDDIDEHTAAALVATRCSATGVVIRPPHHGRVDVHAASDGVIIVDDAQLAAWHMIAGVTIATMRSGSGVRRGQRIATIKILPFALPQHALRETPAPALRQVAYHETRVAVIIIGDTAVWERLHRTHLTALWARLRAFPTVALAVHHVQADVVEVTTRMRQLAHVDLVITLSETSIMDDSDVVPQSVQDAGGVLTCYGAPVEPGNLLLLGQIGRTMVIGAPGCIRSMARNVIDLILPRLFARISLSAADVYALANGGLLGPEDAS